jgi:hypothetical protein
MGSAHHETKAGSAEHAAHSMHYESDVHGATGPASRVHDIPADPLESGAPCALSMACAPAAAAASPHLSLATRRPEPLSTDWPTLVHSSAELQLHSPPPRLIA